MVATGTLVYDIELVRSSLGLNIIINFDLLSEFGIGEPVQSLVRPPFCRRCPIIGKKLYEAEVKMKKICWVLIPKKGWSLVFKRKLREKRKKTLSEKKIGIVVEELLECGLV